MRRIFPFEAEPIKRGLLFILLLAVLSACVDPAEPEDIRVILRIGGESERIIALDEPVTVRQLLDQENIELGKDDRVNPSEFTTLQDGTTVTVTRVVIDTQCEEETIPFEREILPNEAMVPGEEHLAQAGQDGTRRLCYRVETVNGEEVDRVLVGEPVVIKEPVDEIVFQGVEPPPPVAFEGTLAYISNSNVWMMRGNSANKRPLTIDGGLDGLVFDLSPDGRRLVFTRVVEGNPEEFFNSLWVIMDTRETDPVVYELLPDNVLYAEWVPGVDSTVSYSTSDARPTSPGWQAHNNLWLITLDADDGEILQAIEVLGESSGGLFGWWGTNFSWSPDGLNLAWARADGVGLVNLDTRTFEPLFEFSVYNTYSDWAWVPTLSWSPGSDLLLTTVHGPPLGADEPEDSPVFHIAVASPDETIRIDELISQVGIWASPQFSPVIEDEEGHQSGYIAYLQVRGAGSGALSSQSYELVVADRDGSNRRVVFPQDPQAPGLKPQTVAFAWSPDATHIAFIYQGDLWIVEVSTGSAQQLTVDKSASNPVWVE